MSDLTSDPMLRWQHKWLYTIITKQVQGHEFFFSVSFLFGQVLCMAYFTDKLRSPRVFFGLLLQRRSEDCNLWKYFPIHVDFTYHLVYKLVFSPCRRNKAVWKVSFFFIRRKIAFGRFFLYRWLMIVKLRKIFTADFLEFRWFEIVNNHDWRAFLTNGWIELFGDEGELLVSRKN